MNRTHAERSLKAVSLGMMALLLAGCPALLGSGVTSVTGGDHVTVTPASGVGDIVISATAEKGDKGDQGVQGPQGAKGDTGAQGPQGGKGDTGAQGAQGTKGDTGAQGSQGLQGVKGDAGPRGLQGVKGDTGEQGAQGPKGDTGAQGIQGEQGEQGVPGTSPQVNRVEAVMNPATFAMTAPSTWSLVTGLSVNITTTGRPVLIILQGDSAQGEGTIVPNNESIHFQFRRDGVDFTGFGVGGDDIFPASFTCNDTPAAGQHTYGLYMTMGSSSGTSSISNAKLVIMEM